MTATVISTSGNSRLPQVSTNPHSKAIQSDSYYLPHSHCYGNSWQMNFWDAIYYLAMHRGLPIHVTTLAMTTLMNGQSPSNRRQETIRHHFMNSWKEAAQAGWLVECTPLREKAEKPNTGSLHWTYRGPGRIYIFNLPDYAPHFNPSGYIRKPRGYIENGWIRIIGSVYAKRLFNFFLSKAPSHQSFISLPVAQTLKAFQTLAAELGQTVHPTRLTKALSHLKKIGLIRYQGDSCWINWEVLSKPAPKMKAKFQAGEPVYQADWLTAYTEDADRATLAAQILNEGVWDLLTFWRIYTDLGRLNKREQHYIQRQVAALPPVSDRRHHLEWVHLLYQARKAGGSS